VEELRRVERSLEHYSNTHALHPRPALRERILSSLQKKEVPQKESQNKKTEDGDHSLTYKYLIAASLAALVISTFASWFFYNRWNEAEEKYSELLKDKNDLTINFNVVKATYDEALANLLIIRDELSEVYVLRGTDTASNFQARVYWNKFNQRAYLDILSLPEINDTVQFQLWAVSKGTASDAGVIQTDLYSIQRVKDIAEADSWMITMEPKGGSPVPDMDRLVLALSPH
jgi:anti-sigma-K factor RskA